jgi:hypothetical protein
MSGDENNQECCEAFIWLQPDEDEGVADCGCKLHRGYAPNNDGNDPAIVFCPMHEAAPELLAACQSVVRAQQDGGVSMADLVTISDDLIRAAIAKATGLQS